MISQPNRGQSLFPAQEQPWEQSHYDPQAHRQRIGAPHHTPYRQPQAAWQEPGPRRKRHIVRNVLAASGAVAVIIIAIAAANSGHHTVNTTGNGSTATASGTGPASATATIGSAITLTGNSPGEQMTVTITKVISGAQPGDDFSSAPAGNRLYAVQFRLADTGTAAYSDAPSNGAAVVDSSGQSYQASIADTAAGCQGFTASENIAAGASGLGCIIFEVPKAAKIIRVQFTLDSGMGPQAGQWDVAARKAGRGATATRAAATRAR